MRPSAPVRPRIVSLWVMFCSLLSLSLPALFCRVVYKVGGPISLAQLNLYGYTGLYTSNPQMYPDDAKLPDGAPRYGAEILHVRPLPDDPPMTVRVDGRKWHPKVRAWL